MRLHKICLAKLNVKPPAQQTNINDSSQQSISYLEATDDCLLNRKPPIKISFVNTYQELHLKELSLT